MSYCSKCGKKIEEADKFCLSCGEPVETKSKKGKKISKKKLLLIGACVLIIVGIASALLFLKLPLSIDSELSPLENSQINSQESKPSETTESEIPRHVPSDLETVQVVCTNDCNKAEDISMKEQESSRYCMIRHGYDLDRNGDVDQTEYFYCWQSPIDILCSAECGFERMASKIGVTSINYNSDLGILNIYLQNLGSTSIPLDAGYTEPTTSIVIKNENGDVVCSRSVGTMCISGCGGTLAPQATQALQLSLTGTECSIASQSSNSFDISLYFSGKATAAATFRK